MFNRINQLYLYGSLHSHSAVHLNALQAVDLWFPAATLDDIFP